MRNETSTTVADARALIEVDRGLAAAGVAFESRLHDHVDEAIRGENLILVGGPLANLVTRELHRQPVTLPFRFSKHLGCWGITDEEGQVVHGPGIPRRKDNAVVAKLKNPFNRNGKLTYVYLVAGVNGLGTWGAAKLLFALTEQLERRMKESGIAGICETFAALLEVSADGPDDVTVSISRLEPV